METQFWSKIMITQQYYIYKTKWIQSHIRIYSCYIFYPSKLQHGEYFFNLPLWSHRRQFFNIYALYAKQKYYQKSQHCTSEYIVLSQQYTRLRAIFKTFNACFPSFSPVSFSSHWTMMPYKFILGLQSYIAWSRLKQLYLY